MQSFKIRPSAQRFLETYGPAYIALNIQPRLLSRHAKRRFRMRSIGLEQAGRVSATGLSKASAELR
jgi:hypothetical protein